MRALPRSTPRATGNGPCRAAAAIGARFRRARASTPLHGRQHFHAITLGEAGACPHSGRDEFAVDGGRYPPPPLTPPFPHPRELAGDGLPPRAPDDDPHPSP